MLDHNLIFDPDFSANKFFEYHSFTQISQDIRTDLFHSSQYTGKMRECLAEWDRIVTSIPDSWFFADDEQTVAADADIDQFLSILRFCEDESFWNWP